MDVGIETIRVIVMQHECQWGRRVASTGGHWKPERFGNLEEAPGVMGGGKNARKHLRHTVHIEMRVF